MQYGQDMSKHRYSSSNPWWRNAGIRAVRTSLRNWIPQKLVQDTPQQKLGKHLSGQRLPTVAYRNVRNTLPEELVHDTSTPTIAQQVADPRLKRMIQTELLQDTSLQKQVSRI